MTNSSLKLYNIEKFGNICMCGFNITKHNPVTMHHITPKSEGGATDIYNSSNVTNLPHCGIHILSNDSLKRAREIKEYLHYFKEHPDMAGAKQFAQWLEHEVYRLDFIECMTKDHLLIYKRRK